MRGGFDGARMGDNPLARRYKSLPLQQGLAAYDESRCIAYVSTVAGTGLGAAP